MRALALVLLLAACGGKTPPTNREATGGPGAICACHDREPDCVAVTCQPGLTCGYPCGIDGCHSVCMTREENERAPQIP